MPNDPPETDREGHERRDAHEPDVATLRFEAALAELERIVAAIEQGDVPLDESLQRYERGVKLLGRCRSLLRDAEAKLTVLSGDPNDPDGPLRATDVPIDELEASSNRGVRDD